MNNKNGPNKQKKKTRIRVALFLVVIYLVVLAFMSFKPPSIAKVVYGNVASYFETQGMVVRNEKVVYSSKNGYIIKKLQENKRVPKGYKVVQMSNKESVGDLSYQLDAINEKIDIAENKQANGNGFTDDINKIDNDIKGLLSEIKKDARMGTFNITQRDINKLSSMLEKKNAIASDNPFVKDNVTKMENEKKDIEELIRNSYTYTKSPEAGIVSFYIDGYENINGDNISNYDVFNEKPQDNSSKDEGDFVNAGDPLFKVVDNYQWYIYIKVPSKEPALKNGENVKLNIHEKSLDARVVKLIKQNDGHCALLGLNQQYDGFVKDRFVKLKVVKNSDEGMMLPYKSIINANGKRYVYKYASNGIKKIEVKVLATDGDKAVVDSVDKLDGLKVYDEVINDKSAISKHLKTKE